MSLGITLDEQYENYFKFSGESNRSIEEIEKFIHKKKIPSFSYPAYINLNVIDTKNLNALFHIVRKSVSDLDCLGKLKLLIEKYNINYNFFDAKYHRSLPFYTCVKGYLESTKYLIDKMDFHIDFRDSKEETIFFSAMRSYNIELVKYLDEKFKNWIFFPNAEYNTCIYYIFKDSIKKEGEEKIKNLLRFIINKGFDIDEKNNNNFSFRELCTSYGINNYLEDVLKEFKKPKMEIFEREKKLLNDNDNNVNNNINNNISGINLKKKEINQSAINKLNCNQNGFIIENFPINEKNVNTEPKNGEKEKSYNSPSNRKKIILDSESYEISGNNMSASSFEKSNKKDYPLNMFNLNRNNNNEVTIKNEDFFSFSEHLYLNNFEINEKKGNENQEKLFEQNDKGKKERKCCIFIYKNNFIKGDVGKIIETRENLRKFKNNIIWNTETSEEDENIIYTKKKN